MTGKPACPEFLPEKTNPTLLKTATSRIRLARFPSGSAVIQHRFRPRNRCQLVLGWEVVESVSPLFESAQLSLGARGVWLCPWQPPAIVQSAKWNSVYWQAWLQLSPCPHSRNQVNSELTHRFKISSAF